MPANIGPLILAIPGGIVLILLMNKLLRWIFYRYDIAATAPVSGLPDATLEQKEALRKLLFFWDKQCDGCYEAKPVCVDKLFSGEKLNLVDLDRLRGATYATQHVRGTEKHEDFLREIRGPISSTIKALEELIQQRKDHDKIINEQDLSTRQVKIAGWSAFFSAISAIAAAVAAYLTYSQASLR